MFSFERCVKARSKGQVDLPDAKTYETRHGPMLALAGDRYITRSLELYGEFSPEEGALLAQLVRPGMTVVEMGANIGAHSVPLARACAPGPLILFEPQQRVFQILCANLALNGVTNAVVYPEACGEAEGVAVIPALDYAAEFNFGGVSVQPNVAGAVGERVRVTRLDALDLPACNLLKIDVEGFEIPALKGAAGTIRRHRPPIYVENDRPEHQGALIALLAGWDYRLYWHTPALFSPSNFKGEADNVFPGIVSINMLALPAELGVGVNGVEPIDPANWASPVGPRG